MAITKNYTTDQGVNCPNAYILISGTNYNKFPPAINPSNPSPTGMANVSIYFNQATREALQKPLVTFSMYFDPNVNQTMISQAYAALKQMPEMAGAVDC